MISNFDSLTNRTTLNVNQHSVEFEGVGNANEGRLTTALTHDFEFDVEILATMMMVGYPTYSEYKGSAHDLFKPSTLNGGYTYRRSYVYSNGARFTSVHSILYDEKINHLSGVFSTKNFPEEKFRSNWRIHDLVETFIPHAPGSIKSLMAVEWSNGSELLHAKIESEYYFNHHETLPGLHWRHVKFATQHNGRRYVQSEKLTVVDQFDFGSPINQLDSGKRIPTAA